MLKSETHLEISRQKNMVLEFERIPNWVYPGSEVWTPPYSERKGIPSWDSPLFRRLFFIVIKDNYIY